MAARSLAVASLFGALLLATSCKDRADQRALASARIAPAPPPPPGLVMEMFVPRPLEFWPLFRAVLGPGGQFLPQGAELALGTALGLSPIAATALDLRAPVLAAARIDGARTGAILGARLANGAEFVASLTTGASPTHQVENDGEARVLVPLSPATSASALGVLDDTLLAGTRVDLGALGPYVARAMPRKAMPDPATAATLIVGGEALRGTLVPFLRREWNSRRGFLEQSLSRAQSERGRAADLADPRVVLGSIETRVEEAFVALERAHRLEARVIPESARLLLEVELGAGAPLAPTFADVPLATLLAAPEDAFVRFSSGRRSVAAPVGLPQELRALFGERLSETDYVKVEEAVTFIEEGRGSVQVFAGRADGAVVWMGDVQDPKKLEQGLDRGVGLLLSKSVVAPLASVTGPLRARPLRSAVRGLGAPARGATIEVASRTVPTRSPPAARKLELLWTVGQQDFAVVLAPEAAPVLEALLDGRGRAANDGALLAPLTSAAIAGVVDLGSLPLFGAPGPGKAIAFAMNRSDDRVRLRVALSASALAALIGARLQ